VAEYIVGFPGPPEPPLRRYDEQVTIPRCDDPAALADWRERAKGMVHRVPISEGGSEWDLVCRIEPDGEGGIRIIGS
jgi:anti-sigma factor ChrR (cupin superfamily)